MLLDVFFSSLVIDRRAAAITAVGVDASGRRAFLGLDDGMLEEYSLERAGDAALASLTARKPIVHKVLIEADPVPLRTLRASPLNLIYFAPCSNQSSPSFRPRLPTVWSCSQATAR